MYRQPVVGNLEQAKCHSARFHSGQAHTEVDAEAGAIPLTTPRGRQGYLLFRSTMPLCIRMRQTRLVKESARSLSEAGV